MNLKRLKGKGVSLKVCFQNSSIASILYPASPWSMPLFIMQPNRDTTSNLSAPPNSCRFISIFYWCMNLAILRLLNGSMCSPYHPSVHQLLCTLRWGCSRGELSLSAAPLPSAMVRLFCDCAGSLPFSRAQPRRVHPGRHRGNAVMGADRSRSEWEYVEGREK